MSRTSTGEGAGGHQGGTLRAGDTQKLRLEGRVFRRVNCLLGLSQVRDRLPDPMESPPQPHRLEDESIFLRSQTTPPSSAPRPEGVSADMFVATGGKVMLPASTGQRPGMLPHLQYSTGRPPTTKSGTAASVHGTQAGGPAPTNPAQGFSVAGSS